jgi:predicted nucleic acid-binding protein
MIVVADTGPLISLLHVKRLDILEQLYPDYVIAQAVYAELIRYKKIDFNEYDLETLRQHIRTVDTEIKPPLTELGLGEAESVLLLKELNGDALLTDDMEARRVAESLQIQCFGTLALLLKAKAAGLITSIKPLLEELVEHRRFYSKELIQLVLKYAEEQ